MKNNVWSKKALTQFIIYKGIGLSTLTELVRFTADKDRNIARLGYQGDLRGSYPGHDATIGQQSVGSQHHFSSLSTKITR